MNTKHQIPAIAAMTLAAVMSTSLIACNDSTSASNDEQPTSSANPESSASVPESSDALVSSSSTNENFEGACESEGAIDSLMKGNAKYGYIYTYYRCEQGKWTQRPEWVNCDTTGVKEGDLCQLQSAYSGSQFGTDIWTCYKYAGEGTWNETVCPTDLKNECNDENEGVIDSVAKSHYEPSKGVYEDYFYYMCVKGKWTQINSTLAQCTSAKTKIDDECCDIIYNTFKVTYPAYSVLYKYTEDGWATQGVYSDTECKNFSYDPADSCSLPAEACTEGNNNKIDSTLKSAKTSTTCYSLCLNKEWTHLSTEEVEVYSYCGEPNEEGKNRCCYTPPAEITEQYPWYGSAIYVYDSYFGWGVKEYYEAPNCEDTAE